MAIVNATVMIAGAGGAQLAATAGPTFSLDLTIPGTLPSPLTFTRASTATYFDATGLMVTAAVNAPRWDYDPVGLSLKGLLLEDASSNQNPSTISAAGGWTASAAALTAASGIAPDGTNTMTKLTETATTAIHDVGPSLKTITAASAYTFSVYAKAVENRYLQLVVDDNSATGVSANYDLLTGTICLAAAATGSASLRGATIQPVGNGIYRCALSLITSTTATTLRWCCVMQILPTTPKFGTYTGVAGRGLLLWGAQLEPLTYATSFIPTTTPPVSRAINSCGISAANMGWFTGSPGGSWYVEFDYFPTIPTNNRIFGRPNTPGVQAPFSVGVAPNNYIGQYDGVSGVNAASPTTPNTVVKVASTWTVGQAQQCTNGSAVGTSAALTTGYGSYTTTGIQLMPLGPSAVGDNCSGHIRLLSYWSRALSGWEMQGLTGTTPLGGAGNVRATAAVLVGAAAAISGGGGFGAAPITPWPAAALIAGIGGAPLNYLPNPRCQGAVPGTPGTLPTNWGNFAVGAGITQTVVGTGIEAGSGLPYVDIRYSGAPTAPSSYVVAVFNLPLTNTPVFAANTPLTLSVYMAMVAGSMANINDVNIQIRDPFAQPATIVSPLTATLTRYTNTSTLAVAAIQTNAAWGLNFPATAGLPIDITLRFGPQQLEIGTVATAQIYPPVGQVALAARGIIAINDTGVRAAANTGIGGAGALAARPLVSREIAAAGLGGVGSVQATAGLLRVASALIAGFGGRINYVPNPNGEGGTVGTIGSGGVPPTGYTYNLGAGLTLQYLGQFTAAGIPLTRWRYFGTASDTAALGINPWRAGYPGIVAGMPYGATLVESFWHRLVAGSTAGMGSFNSWGDARDAINTPQGVGVVGFTPGPNLTRLTVGTTFTVGPPPYTIIGIGTVFYNNGAGSVIDFTIDIGGWQLEILSASSLILPPVGAPGQARRGVEALPYIPNYAAIAGAGSVQANGLVTRSANARIDGVGGGLFVVSVASPANARIDGRGAGIQVDGLNTRPANATIAGVGSVRPGSPILFADADTQIDGVGSVVRGTAIDIGVANAQLNGAGGVRADGFNMRPAGAQALAGIGSVRATGVALRPASAQIDGTGGQTNWIRNPNGDGAAVGGDLPTYWSTPLLPGLASEITRTGIDPASGLAYVDIHFLGNTFVDGNLFLYIEPSTYSIAAPGDTFTTTAWFSITGSLANISQIFYNASIATGNIATPIAPSATFARYGGTGTLGPGATAIGLCYFQLFVTQGAVDITLRLGGFQLERGTLRTPLISPQPGDPEVTTRALLAMPTTQVAAAAEIDGQGGIRFTQGAARSTAAAEIDGQGHLAVETSTPGRAFGGALIGGRGGVLVQPFMRYLETVTIHGTGSVRASPLSKTPAGITRLVGVGKVQASTSVLRRGAAKIQGTGQRAGRAVAIRVAEAAIHGLGALRAPNTRLIQNAAARIAGTGGVSARGYHPLAVIRGAGHVTALVSVVSRVLARIGGVGSLSATAGKVAQVQAQARIDGVGSLNARAARLISASARINGTGHFEAYLDASRPGLAAIRGVGQVTASARVVSSVSATIRGAGHVTLDGTPVHQIRQAGAAIHGVGSLRASGAFRGAWQAVARIDGVGKVRASTAASLVTWSATARINGTGKVGVKVPTAIAIAGSTIHGVGRVRASAVVTVTQQAISSVGGIGRVHATAVVRATQQAVSRVSGAGKVVASATRAVATAARIAGTGLIKALATGTTRWSASATINGAGGVRAFTRTSYPVSAAIRGTGGVRATAGVVQHALAVIGGTAATKIAGRVLTLARARIAGLGQLHGNAIRAPKLAGARINGTGKVGATIGRVQPEDVRINGRGSVTARPGALRPARATINGIGRVRAKPAVEVHVRVQIHGLGTVIADPDLKSIHHAVARIEGEGGVEPDPFIPRDRVALYGVHLPATKRGVLV